MPQERKGQADNVAAVNRQAYRDYDIIERYEAGLALTGTEIKSIRAGRVNLREAYARGQNGELWLYNAHVAQWPGGNRYNHDPIRPRKLLLHKSELRDLLQRVASKGLTVVPLRLYFKRHRAKLELGLARGRKKYDKREIIARRDAEREMRRAATTEK
ncbi:MAG: SsrA-binding protein SmpB [Chloroflexi bacterium]|nr:SsrA-binding protein SmpB [Chloroflexota bacterium]